MPNLTKERKIDALVNHFRKNGFMTLSRKFSNYLPEPESIGRQSVDAVAKLRKRIAVGIVLTKEELDDNNIYSRLTELADNCLRYKNVQKIVYLGVGEESINKANIVVSFLSQEIRKIIKIVPLKENQDQNQ